MKNYTYNEITIGQEEEFTAVLTEEHMALFRQVSGDRNPLHTDTIYAKSKKFDGKVVYGILTAAFLSTLAGMYLPGKYCLIQEVTVQFPNACYITGDEITIRGKVIEKNDIFRCIVLKVRIIGSTGVTLLRGKMRIGVMDDGK